MFPCYEIHSLFKHSFLMLNSLFLLLLYFVTYMYFPLINNIGNQLRASLSVFALELFPYQKYILLVSSNNSKTKRKVYNLRNYSLLSFPNKSQFGTNIGIWLNSRKLCFDVIIVYKLKFFWIPFGSQLSTVDRVASKKRAKWKISLYIEDLWSIKFVRENTCSKRILNSQNKISWLNFFFLTEKIFVLI